MDTEHRSRATLALPNPQEPTRGPEIELLEAPFSGNILLEKDISFSRKTWLIFLKREVEFLGVTQILIGFTCLYFGTIVYPGITISEFEKKFFSSFQIGYPFWGAVLFAISGFLSVISEKKNATYLVHGSLGANLVSCLAAGAGIFLLVKNLQNAMAYHNICWEAFQDDFCFTVFFSTEIVAMIMFLTILGFGAAVLLIVYRIGELLKEDKVQEERLYEELNIYSPIYSELEAKEETSPIDS
ncbi:membrane spanning 4-domains A2 [Phyllostomus discolor]|uniref:high affinity immunoglobulin epsilon receptor subunit beta n=1 Tax=Phyllostomus discolor TaxID=89673 RepID=UPI00105B1422|nr:high affinity immunoglobulin epsilon receptor subunit beta [Phyllostomus discolor]KAF6104900.1 membrane spanning 4-domains A2 [Phyllostomus discolor]